MEDVTNKSFDVNERFGEIEEISNSQITGIQSKYEIIIIALEIVSDLIDIFNSVRRWLSLRSLRRFAKLQIKSVMREIMYGVCPRKKRMARS